MFILVRRLIDLHSKCITVSVTYIHIYKLMDKSK